MRLEVAFTSALLPEPGGKLCIVIDLLRLTSTLAVMFARGLEEALVAETVDEARRLAAARPDWLLCGEEGGFPPAGFDYGNSPSEFAELELRDREQRHGGAAPLSIVWRRLYTSPTMAPRSLSSAWDGTWRFARSATNST